MALIEMWPLANSAAAAINPVTRNVIGPAFNEIFGENNGRFFFITLQAAGVSPDAFHPEDFVARFPYANIERVTQNFKDAAEAGFLNNHGDGSFTITEQGKKATNAINEVFYGALGKIEALPDNAMERLEGLLNQLVQAALEAETLGDKTPLVISHKGHTHPDAALLARIDQHLDDLNAFRDVSHIAAWASDHDIPGRTWETLAFVHSGRENTAVGIAERLPFRGYSEEDYAASLAQLVDLGWIEDGSEGYVATEKGNKVRQTAEEKTNKNFYAPWSALENNQLNQLRVGLIRLKLRLESLVEPA
jgi:hypothetical protein